MGPIQSSINSVVDTALKGIIGQSFKRQNDLANEKLRQEEKYNKLYHSLTGEAISGKMFSNEDIKKVQDLENDAINKAKFEQSSTNAAINRAGGIKTEMGKMLEKYGQERSKRNVDTYRESLQSLFKEMETVNKQNEIIKVNRYMLASKPKEDK